MSYMRKKLPSLHRTSCCILALKQPSAATIYLDGDRRAEFENQRGGYKVLNATGEAGRNKFSIINLYLNLIQLDLCEALTRSFS
jgi:hypothetical protein